MAEVDSRNIINMPREQKDKIYDKMSKATSRFTDMNFNIDDKTQYIEDIISNIRMLKAQNKIDVVFIDYIGLIKTREKSFSRENEVSKISRDLKLVARECNIPIILLAQLNRLAESSEPSLAMLRESGSLEQDANKVIFLYQEEEQKATAVGILKVKVAKNHLETLNNAESFII
jgi:replicative DNA helicase